MSQADLDYTSIGGKKEKQVENTEEVKRLQDIMMGERKDQEAKRGERDLLDLEKENIFGENWSSRRRGKKKGGDLDIMKERRVKVIIIAIITLLITNINIGILGGDKRGKIKGVQAAFHTQVF